jgi:hypothetical protein
MEPDYNNLPFTNEPPPKCPPVQQEQMPVKYLSEEDNFCVTARSEVSGNSKVPSPSILQPLLNWLRFTSDEIPINVFNFFLRKPQFYLLMGVYANNGGVNGAPYIVT